MQSIETEGTVVLGIFKVSGKSFRIQTRQLRGFLRIRQALIADDLSSLCKFGGGKIRAFPVENAVQIQIQVFITVVIVTAPVHPVIADTGLSLVINILEQLLTLEIQTELREALHHAVKGIRLDNGFGESQQNVPPDTSSAAKVGG